MVTAQKRQNLQDVPFSVATSQAQIRRWRENIVDLARNVAGLSIADLGPGQSQMAIRGISSGQVIRDQPGVKEQVGVYLDESPISIALFTPDLELFDLERFEVLRGPQGTLFGAGSEAGTVRYITRQPQLGRRGLAPTPPSRTSTHGDLGGVVRRRSTSRSAIPRRCVWWPTGTTCPASSMRSSPMAASRRTSTTATATGVRCRCSSSRTMRSRLPRGSSTRTSPPTASRARTSTTSWPIPTPPWRR